MQQLRYIVAIEQYGHFGKAAEACDSTQPTLSLMVRKLEEELDVRIFDRDSHPVVPTEIGRKVIERAKMVLYGAGQISEMTRSEKESLSGPLRVALISTVAPVLVPGLFKFIGQNYPAIGLQTEEMITETIKDKLHKAEVDIGILTSPVNDPELLEIPLYTEKFFAYVSEDDPAYPEESISSEALFSRPVWIMKSGLKLFDFSRIGEDEMITYEGFFEGGRVGTLIQIVNDNGGMTVIPETHIGLILYSLQKGIRPIVNPEPRRTIAIAIRRDYIHEAMLNAVVKAVRQIIPAGMQESVIRRDYIRL
ncbi:MAG: LysR family transcriptional regulator [Bacteroidales bacterium]|nr:LysR family transcriptional regulator [Bacteroidales bacterium]